MEKPQNPGQEGEDSLPHNSSAADNSDFLHGHIKQGELCQAMET